MDKKSELKALLENVPGSYIDFVHGGLLCAEEHNAYDKLIKFIKENPDATSSDVIYFETVELDGIKPLTDEEKQAYLDSLK